MIKMQKIEDFELVSHLNKQENTDAQYAYGLYDGKELSGYLLFSVKDKNVFLLKVKAENNLLKDGLVRAVLNFVSLHGISKAEFSEDFDSEFLIEYQISKSGEKRIENIEEVFKKCCG